MTNALPRFIYSSLNYNDYNFRVWGNGISNAIKGTKCSASSESRFGEEENNIITFTSADEAESI